MKQAIGVIDSGVGGLTVVHELMRQLPNEKLIYLGDTLRCPYGSRTAEEIKQFTWEMVDFLLSKNIKMLVIACNTATAYTLEELKEKLNIPVIGVIQPGARAAIKVTQNNQVGVIGTEGTIQSRAYEQALKKVKADIQVYSLACPLLVPMVEKGVLLGRGADRVVEQSLQPIKAQKSIDTLILGCTHYPLIKQPIQDFIGPDVAIISSSEETAREVSAILDIYHLFNKDEKPPIHAFYTTGQLSIFKNITNRIFNHPIHHLQRVTIEKTTI
ncbi:MAG TPA: glutamate racemase [Bacillota bacterium]|nr:glutamate racemase [Bacillota bacterium]